MSKIIINKLTKYIININKELLNLNFDINNYIILRNNKNNIIISSNSIIYKLKNLKDLNIYFNNNIYCFKLKKYGYSFIKQIIKNNNSNEIIFFKKDFFCNIIYDNQNNIIDLLFKIENNNEIYDKNNIYKYNNEYIYIKIKNNLYIIDLIKKTINKDKNEFTKK